MRNYDLSVNKFGIQETSSLHGGSVSVK